MQQGLKCIQHRLVFLKQLINNNKQSKSSSQIGSSTRLMILIQTSSLPLIRSFQAGHFRSLVRLALLTLSSLFLQSAHAQTPDELWIGSGHASSVAGVAYSPDGSLMVSGSFD